MKAAVKYGLLGTLVFVLCLVITVPAAWVWHWVPNKPPQLKLSEISGSVWQGRIGHANVDGREIEQIQWQLEPSALLFGNLAANVSLDGAVVQGQGFISYGFGDLQAKKLRLNAPLKWLVGKQRLPMRTRLDGYATLNLHTLEQGLPWCEQLQGRLLLESLDVKNQFGAYPLGNIAASLGCQQGQLLLTIDQAENAIGLDGTALLKADNQVQINATIRQTEQQPQSLTQALQFVGKPDSNGVYPLNYNGPIPGL